MTSTMTPSQRRRAYKLKRIVISEHNYLALKRLEQAGDSFNDVIRNLLWIENNHREEKEKDKKLRELERMRQWQQESRTDDDNDCNISNLTNVSYPSDIVDETIKEYNQQMDEIFRTIEEAGNGMKRDRGRNTNHQTATGQEISK